MKKLLVACASLALFASVPAHALERNWCTSKNYALNSTSVLTSSRNSLWFIGALLLGNTTLTYDNAGTCTGTPTGTWTVHCSTDGVTYPSDDCSTDHTDRGHLSGSGAFTLTDWLRGALGVAHSFYVLKSPSYNGVNYYLGVSWNSASDQTVTVTFSKNVMKCAANPCTNAGDPTATDIVTVGTGGYTFDPNSIATQNRAHGSLSASGDFWFMTSRDAAGFSVNPLIFSFLADNDTTNDNYPIVLSVRALTATYETSGDWADCNASNATKGSFGQSMSGAAATTNMHMLSYTHNNAGNLNKIFGTSGNQGTDWTGTDSGNGKYRDLPIYIESTTTNCSTANSLRGRLPDFRYAPSSLANGTVGPSVSPFSVMSYNAFWLPWVATAAPTL